jgi:hypothetical protein
MTPHLIRTALGAALLLFSAGCDGLFERSEPRPLVFDALHASTTATFFSLGDTIDGGVATENGVRISVPVRVTNVSDEPTAVVWTCPTFQLVTTGGRATIEHRRLCSLMLVPAVMLEPGENWTTTAEVTGCFVDEGSMELDDLCDGRWMVEQVRGRYRWTITYSDQPLRRLGSLSTQAFNVIDPRLVTVNVAAAP